tara:strand:+ start:423 stop:932 length:510 start_codon:yes stop_codon:yes gene_type:complete
MKIKFIHRAFMKVLPITMVFLFCSGYQLKAYADYDKAAYAVSFMYFGDNTETYMTNGLVKAEMSKDCIYTIDINEKGAFAGPSTHMVVDFNLVNWGSSKFGYLNGQQNFKASCQGNCIKERTSSDEIQNATFKMLPKNTFDPVLTVTRERFEKAVKYVSNLCIGYKSAF